MPDVNAGRLVEQDPERTLAFAIEVARCDAPILMLDLAYAGGSAAERTAKAMQTLKGEGLDVVRDFEHVIPGALSWSYDYQPNSHRLDLYATDRKLVYSGMFMDGTVHWQTLEGQYEAVVFIVANFDFYSLSPNRAGFLDQRVPSMMEAAMSAGLVLGASIGRRTRRPN